MAQSSRRGQDFHVDPSVSQASPHSAVQLDNGTNSMEASAQSCPDTREDLGELLKAQTQAQSSMITALLDTQERKHQIFLRKQEEKMEKRQEKI